MEQKTNQNYTQQHSQISQETHLSDYFNVLRRRKWVIMISFFIVVSIVTYKSFTSPPVYKATSKIIIEKRSSFDVNVEKVTPVSTAQGYYETQYSLLKSRTLSGKVIEDLKLSDSDISFQFTVSAYTENAIQKNSQTLHRSKNFFEVRNSLGSDQAGCIIYQI